MLKRSLSCEDVFCAPGNAEISNSDNATCMWDSLLLDHRPLSFMGLLTIWLRLESLLLICQLFYAFFSGNFDWFLEKIYKEIQKKIILDD